MVNLIMHNLLFFVPAAFAGLVLCGEGCRHKEKQIVHYQVDHDHLLGLLVIPV